MESKLSDIDNSKVEPILFSSEIEGEQLMGSFFDAVPLAINIWDSNMNNLMCNKQVLNMFGLETVEEYLSNFQKFSPEYQPNGVLTSEMIKRNIEEVKREGFHKFKWLHLDSEGADLPAEINLTLVTLGDKKEYIVGSVRDLRPEFNKSSGQDDEDFYFLDKIPEKTLLSKLSELSDDLIFSVDTRTANVNFLGGASKNVLIYNSNSTSETNFHEKNYVHRDDIELYEAMLRNMSKGICEPVELRFIQSDGSYVYYRINYRFIFDKQNQPIIIIGKGVNINEQKLLLEKSKFDSLTECYNKSHIEEIIASMICCDGVRSSALLFVDISDFKSFNETNGHFSGDEMLRQVAARIRKWVRDDEIVGRIGGDEFLIYAPKIKDVSHFEKRLDQLLSDLNGNYQIHTLNTDVRIYVGVALCDKERISYEECVQRADRALFVAKQSQKGRWLYYDESQNDYSLIEISKEAKAAKISGLNMDHSVSASIFNILYERNSDKTAITSALQYLAQSYDASKCFVAESYDDGITFHSTYEWCLDRCKLTSKEHEAFSSKIIEQLIRNATSNGIFVCEDVSKADFKKELSSVLDAYSTKSFIHSQVEKDGVVTFFIGIEDCDKTRKWTDAQINTLSYMTRVFSIVLQGKRLNEEVKVLSERNKISAFVGDNTDNFIYIVDPENYQILYMNKKALKMYDNPNEEVWRSRKCYELLHEKTEPCDFCTNKYTTENEFYEWNYYNPRFDKTYLFKDKLVQLNGKLVKLQIATDITKVVALEEALKLKLEEQSLLLDCIKMLHTSDAPVVSIEKILNIICQFFGATRGVILQLSNERDYLVNTHEWTNEGIAPKKHTLQNLSIDLVTLFVEMFHEKGVFYAPDALSFFEEGSPMHSILKDRGAESLICASILDAEGDFIGMFAVDSPKYNTDKYWLLGTLSGFVADFLEKNKLIDSLNRLSYYDTMTQIKNRESYRKALEEIDESVVTSLGVAYIDISGLSKINEEKGSRYGDEIIKKMSRILTDIFKDNTFRVGGDEFVVLEKNVTELVFEGKINTLKSTIFEDPELNASIGFTWNTNISDEDDENINYNTVFDNRNYTAILSNNLENEIRSGKYVVYLQPQINLQTNELDGAEALIRRIDAGGNIQSPASFVPFYEKEGMISKIDMHVFETVCELVSEWKRRNIEMNIKFSVNCSRSTIMEKDIVSRLSAICEKYSVSKSMFVIEITETITHSDDNVFSYIISSMKNAGFCVSLDDFGSGYSNLSSLQISDFDEIKIDMGLTKTVHLDKKSKILTKVALNLCSEFEGMVSVAEGIETQEQFDVLRDLACHKGQGYYLSKPISIEDFEKKYIYAIQ